MRQKYDSYIICATPRSGSTLLCDLLTDTGVAGQPDSFFRQQSFTWWTNYLNVSTANWTKEDQFDRAYLNAIKKYGTNDTTLFGMRLMWESVADLTNRLKAICPVRGDESNLLQQTFGNPFYLHLCRQDKVAQAVSLMRAEQTGLWHRFADGSERERLETGIEPFYDKDRLWHLSTTLDQQDAAWSAWFARNNITPLRVTYEDLSLKPNAVLATVCQALQIGPANAILVKPRSAKMADSKSLEWANRFQTECK